MKFILVFLYLLFLLPTNIKGTSSSLISEVKSQRIIKSELHKVAHNFRTTLRKELSKLELEMYSDFLSFVQEVDESHNILSDALNEQLSEQISEMLVKFSKVMTYSTLKIKALNDKLNNIAKKLGGWMDEEEPTLPVLHHQDDFYTATIYESVITRGGRSRRHAVGWQKHLIPQQSDTTSNNIKTDNPATTDNTETTGNTEDITPELWDSDPYGEFPDLVHFSDPFDEPENSLFVLWDNNAGQSGNHSSIEAAEHVTKDHWN